MKLFQKLVSVGGSWEEVVVQKECKRGKLKQKWWWVNDGNMYSISHANRPKLTPVLTDRASPCFGSWEREKSIWPARGEGGAGWWKGMCVRGMGNGCEGETETWEFGGSRTTDLGCLAKEAANEWG